MMQHTYLGEVDMEKKALTVAVAGALAAPALALAQSNVTISGYVHMSAGNIKISQPAPARTTTSESRVNDESSSGVILQVREELGGGNAALVRVDVKTNLDTSTIAATGESYVGLAVHNAGRFTVGRHSLHFFKTPDDGWFNGVTLRVHPSSIIDYAGGGVVTIANATRTPNSVKWSSPVWSGFSVDVGYSFNPTTTPAGEADMTAGNTARKGNALNVNPAFTAGNWAAGYSYWDGKSDAPTAATQLALADQRSDSLYGYYRWGGFKFGAMWNVSKLTAAAAGALGAAGTEIGNRTAWSIPVRYTVGQHNFFVNYTKARDDKATAAADGATLWGASYIYAFSKRTFAGFTVGRLTNEAGAAYSPYGDRGIGIGSTGTTSGLGSTNSGAAPGEDYRVLAFNIRHTY